MALGIATAFFSGCQFKGGRPVNSAVATQKADHQNVWYPNVKRLSIYPSTRIVYVSGNLRIEATIQLIDVMGDAIKSPGHLRIALYKATGFDSAASNSKLNTWDIDISTLKQQEKYYSPITRGYFLPLELSSSYAEQNPVWLQVVFVAPGGHRVTVRRKLPIEW